MEEMRYDRNGAVSVLTINRPKRRNAMTWAMYDRLIELCDVVDEDEKVRVWVLRATAGRAFVSGTDIYQFTDFWDDSEAGVRYEARIDRVMSRLAMVTKPTIAQIEGFATGGGLLIALACDLRYATPESRLGVPSVKLGNCLSMASYARLLQAIGPAHTLELMYTGRLVSADEARSMGLLNDVIPSNEIGEVVDGLAQTITGSAPLTVMATKEAVRRLTDGQEVSGEDLVRRCYNSIDFREGVTAFLEKREPVWRGQ